MAQHRNCKRCGEFHEDTLDDQICCSCRKPEEFPKEEKKKSRGPMTTHQRVDRLFDNNPFPTYEEIEKVIWDAEFDALNFPDVISQRHGL